MLYTAEDAIQIYHAKSSTLEFFAAKVPKADWQGIRKEDIEPAQEYYSDDIIVDFDLLDRDAYEEKVCGGAHSDLPDAKVVFLFTSTVSGGLRALKCAIQTCKKGGKSIFVSKL